MRPAFSAFSVMVSMPTSGMPSRIADDALPELISASKPSFATMRAVKGSPTPGSRTTPFLASRARNLAVGFS